MLLLRKQSPSSNLFRIFYDSLSKLDARWLILLISLHNTLSSFLIRTCNSSIPLVVRRYFWRGCLGESGYSGRMKPSFIDGERWTFRKLSRPFSPRLSIISFTDNSLFPTARTRASMFGLSVWNLSRTCPALVLHRKTIPAVRSTLGWDGYEGSGF